VRNGDEGGHGERAKRRGPQRAEVRVAEARLEGDDGAEQGEGRGQAPVRRLEVRGAEEGVLWEIQVSIW
jgi:hypothetical protein